MRSSPGIFATLVLVSLLSIACQSAIRETVYSAYEKIGVQKRDLLKKRVEKARDEQKETTEEFRDALEHLRALYAIEGGGDLEKAYDTIRDDHDDLRKNAADAHDSIEKMDTVAQDLFREWEKEIGEIQTASYRTDSRQKLRETRDRYAALHTSLVQSEKSMEPVLAKLNDQVLYLKHNLNARAIGSLRSKGAEIQGEVARIIERAKESMEKANGFIAEVGGG